MTSLFSSSSSNNLDFPEATAELVPPTYKNWFKKGHVVLQIDIVSQTSKNSCVGPLFHIIAIVYKNYQLTPLEWLSFTPLSAGWQLWKVCNAFEGEKMIIQKWYKMRNIYDIPLVFCSIILYPNQVGGLEYIVPPNVLLPFRSLV